jgi:acetate kinase
MTILAVNAGSSTLKFALYPIDADMVQPAVLAGTIEGLSGAGPLTLRWTDGSTQRTDLLATTDADAFDLALQALQSLLWQECRDLKLQAVAHRVVHGGASYRDATVVDEHVLAALDQLCPLAPLHQPHNLKGIRAFARSFASVPQIACFDTAFHADLPDVEYNFALPQALTEQGIRRYGFHGLSYQYVLHVLIQCSARAQSRVVMAHLGNGASVCGAHRGKSRATSMGFSALDGLMMGTRSGALDPGVLLYLLEQGWDHAQLQDLLYRQSGLLGVSGISSDMRELRRSSDAQADLAMRMFAYRVVRETGAITACLGGLDVLAFTGGIGEHDAALRSQVCDQLGFLGVQIDQQKNAMDHGAQAVALHLPTSSVEVWVIPTDEGRVAAQAAVDLL